jgi:hypothetical protein
MLVWLSVGVEVGGQLAWLGGCSVQVQRGGRRSVKGLIYGKVNPNITKSYEKVMGMFKSEPCCIEEEERRTGACGFSA